MKKLVLLLTLLSTPFVCAHKRNTEEDYKKAEQLAYEIAKKNKNAEHDDFHRRYLDVVMENYKQSWFDHHPILTAGIVVLGIIAVMALIGSIAPDPNRGGGGAQARPDADALARAHPGARERLRAELAEMRERGRAAAERRAAPDAEGLAALRVAQAADAQAAMLNVGRNPALAGDPRYAGLPRPRPDGAPAVQHPVPGAGPEGVPHANPPAYGEALAAPAVVPSAPAAPAPGS